MPEPSRLGPAILDETDKRILALLQDDARASVRAIARAIDMSPGAVGERLEKLQNRGVIRGFTVDIDMAALGVGMEVLIGLQVNQRRPMAETVEALLDVPGVASVHIVTGRWDLVALLRVRDQDHLKQLLIHTIWTIPDFQHSDSMMILDSYQPRNDPALVLPQ